MSMSAATASMLAGVIGGTINAAGAMAAPAVSSKLGYKYSSRLAGYQNQLALGNWSLQQAYNSPAEQMKRFKEAGLNPNLIYGQGNPGNASAPPDASNVGNYDLQLGNLQLGSMFMDNILKYQQYRKTREDTILADAQARERNIKVSQEVLRTRLMTDEYNAIQLFCADKLHTEPFFAYPSRYGYNTELSGSDTKKQGFQMSDLDVNFERLRRSPKYLELELLWNRKQISDKQLLELAEHTNNVLKFNRVFNMDGASTKDFFTTTIRLVLQSLLGGGKIDFNY